MLNLKTRVVVLIVLAVLSTIVTDLIHHNLLFGLSFSDNGRLLMIAAFILVQIIWGGMIIVHDYKPLRHCFHTLSQLRDTVETSAGQSYEIATQLADGVSEQAANLEETAASLEQITSISFQNSENAKQGRLLIEDNQSLVEKASTSMKDMAQAMGEITGASQAISKIIKKINEVAFQTDLLALNAAVEAARAGEHGAGFAVVADEVRSLAKRAADAADETQELIQNAITRVDEGTSIVRVVETHFNNIVDSSSKSTELVREIAESSEEQRTGLQQVSDAIHQIDSIVQRNADQAAECANTSKGLEDAIQEFRQTVADFGGIMEGSNARKSAINLVKKSVIMARKKGLHEAVMAIQDKHGPFVAGDELYVYAVSLDPNNLTCLAHPYLPEKLVGPDLRDFKDNRGKVFFADIAQSALTQGEGWVNYWWPKPGETHSSFKSTYVLRVPGEPAAFCAGIYA